METKPFRERFKLFLAKIKHLISFSIYKNFHHTKFWNKSSENIVCRL